MLYKVLASGTLEESKSGEAFYLGQRATPLIDAAAESSSAQIAWHLVPPATLLLLPSALTLLFRRATSHAPEADRYEVWSGYRRKGRLIVFSTIAVWWALWDLNGASGIIPSLFGSRPRAPGEVNLQVLLFWVLPIASLASFLILSYSVDRAIQELRWSRMEIVRQGGWGVVRYAIPLLMIATGFDAVFNGESVGILWIIGAAAVAVLGKVRLERAQGVKWHQVTSGELRNRAFAIARKMGIRLRLVYIVPEGKGHLTNAFARALNSIALTDNLPKYLTKPEVDCVIAHELAHVKAGHVRKFSLVIILTFSALVLLLFRLPPCIQAVRPLLDLGVAFLPLSIFCSFSRRFEYAADRDAVVLTGDAEVTIRSLVKLYRVSRMPIQWGRWTEIFMTHPSLTRRALAIARVGQIPAARVYEILQEAGARKTKLSDTSTSVRT